MTAAYAGIGSGLPALRPERVIAVAAFSSSVGTGTLVTAMEEQDAFRENANEFGATTGRPRDMGYFDAVATRNGVELQAATEIALTKIDCLSGMKDLKICVAYEGDTLRTQFGHKLPRWAQCMSKCQAGAKILPVVAPSRACQWQHNTMLSVLKP